MHQTTEGIVIKQTPLKENNRLLTILTKKYGVIHAYANGTKTMKGKGMSSLDLFSYSKFVLFYAKERYVVDSADHLHIFFGIRGDLTKLSLASYFAQLCVLLAPRKEKAGDFLRLILNSLYLLEEDKRHPLFLKAVFELHALSLAGYMPNLVGCRECGHYNRGQMYFSIEDGDLICASCLKGEMGNRIILSPSVLHAMRHILYAEMEKLFSFSLPDNALEELNKITESFLVYQIAQKPSTLDFLKSVLDI